MRYARNVEFNLKSGSENRFDELFNKDVLPILRNQEGFQDELTLIDRESRHAMGISFWSGREQANRYQNETYPKVLETLKPVLDGEPTVHTYEVGPSTLKE